MIYGDVLKGGTRKSFNVACYGSMNGLGYPCGRQEPVGLGRKAKAKSEAVECLYSEHRDRGVAARGSGDGCNFMKDRNAGRFYGLRGCAISASLQVAELLFSQRKGGNMQHGDLSEGQRRKE